MDSISVLINQFQLLSFDHIYRKYNQEVDRLSKKALIKEPGKLIYYKCVGKHEGPLQFLDIYEHSWISLREWFFISVL
jgi:hypothetical protein